jgi:hypothetical protein
MPPGAIYVGRPGPWGNPFGLKDQFARDHPLRRFVDEACLEVLGAWTAGPDPAWDILVPVVPAVAVDAFRCWLRTQPELIERARRELRGHTLACWCPEGSPCHRDIWLAVANDPEFRT